ncbi:hypothetical protein ACFWXA_37320, partial [Streptomyces atroolivaceus]|uniref:hypothetical protein n=1 Tax=Streptomyces atroolivaceus TaxID=66869 RepID=UPI0036600DDC
SCSMRWSSISLSPGAISQQSATARRRAASIPSFIPSGFITLEQYGSPAAGDGDEHADDAGHEHHGGERSSDGGGPGGSVQQQGQDPSADEQGYHEQQCDQEERGQGHACSAAGHRLRRHARANQTLPPSGPGYFDNILDA